jgi:hypothetical protein
MALEEYIRKRDFSKTSEPRPGRLKVREKKLSYLSRSMTPRVFITTSGWNWTVSC